MTTPDRRILLTMSSCVSDISPGLRMTSPEYPDGQRSSEAIVAGELTAVCESGTPTVKGLPGSALTSIYSTCQVRVYSGRGSSQVWTKADKGQRQGAGQEVSPARVGDRLDSMTKDNEH